MKKIAFFFLLATFFIAPTVRSQNLYFPPVNNTLLWDTISPASLGWCVNEIDTLYNFLQQENTKGFILLKEGKIVLEKYFGTFTQDSVWYWASAGKTITSLLTGIAQEENFLSIGDTSAKYLGNGWTITTPAQEAQIKIINQLSMTSGLDDGVPDNHCTIDTCLVYLADAGTRWAYHNAPYTLLAKVLENATGQSINVYTQAKLKTPTGMTGAWLMVDFDNVYYSKARTMARFGLLIQNNGIWDTDTLLHDTTYMHSMVNTSQALNNSYGYLWWLNGKTSYMLPTTQVIIPGAYAPAAPADMIAGLGKNGQIVSISKSKGLVMVRMGESPNSPQSGISTVFCDQIWQKLNTIMCNPAAVNTIIAASTSFTVFPNPAQNEIHLETASTEKFSIEITDLLGVIKLKSVNEIKIDVSSLPPGIYIIRVKQEGRLHQMKFVKW